MEREIEFKLLRLCLNEASTDGEALAAFQKLHSFITRNGTLNTTETKEVSRYSTQIMTFGKYKGDYIEDIAQKDPDYLWWVLQKCERISPNLRHVIRSFLD